MDVWNRNVVRGGLAGLSVYAILYPVTLWLGPKIAPSCAKLSKRERLEWAAYGPSTFNAITIAAAISRHIMNVSLRSSRIFAHVAGTEFWFGELIGYIFGDLLFLVGMGPNMGNYWPMVFHHVVTIASYGAVCMYRRMSWYGCALIMLESTTPFGNFRYLMSKSDNPLTGKNSVLYNINAGVWLIVFFAVRVCTIPMLLSCGHRDAVNLLRSATVTRSDRLVFFGLLGSYLAMCPLNVFWFSKMVRGALKLLQGQDPEAGGKPKQ